MAKNQSKIGIILRLAMEENSYTVRHFAELTGIDKATISRILNGQRKPNLQHLRKFSSVLTTPLNDLVAAMEDEESSYSTTPVNSTNESEFNKHSIKEIELLQKSVELYDPTVTIRKISSELDGYGEYATSVEGRTLLKDSFDAKVTNFGDMGPYIQRLKTWHRQFHMSKGGKKEIAIIGGALLYFILPFDLLHDYVFAVGYLDDCLAIQLAGNKLENKD